MSTEQVVANIQQHSLEASKRLLSDEERELARQHVEARDFGVLPNQTPSSASNKKVAKRGSSFVTAGISTLITLLLVGIVTLIWLTYRHELDRTTAERELKAYATILNQKLPSNNQVDIDSVTVQYPFGSPMEVSFSQGNAHCTAPVNPPDDQHNLYWVDRVDAVPLENLVTSRYKCVATVSLAGLGAN